VEVEEMPMLDPFALLLHYLLRTLYGEKSLDVHVLGTDHHQ